MAVGIAAGDVAYWALAFFLVALGVGSLFALMMVGDLLSRLSSFIRGTERDLLPVIVKAGHTVDRVNYQLDKADTVTDSAVAMADSADTAVRAVSHAIARPVEKVSGVAAGLAQGIASLRRNRDVQEAMSAFKDAARRREEDLAEDLRGVQTPPSTVRPAATTVPVPQAKPAPTPKPVAVPKPEPVPEPPDEKLPPAA
ncbi:MAG: DUF948 domain-containing protein [Actinobacteria bacterium]|nr:DUF948 domain-containing protein [Actinomycetota bacterium]